MRSIFFNLETSNYHRFSNTFTPHYNLPSSVLTHPSTMMTTRTVIPITIRNQTHTQLILTVGFIGNKNKTVFIPFFLIYDNIGTLNFDKKR